MTTDLKTNIAGAVGGAAMLLGAFGVHLPAELQGAIAAIAFFFVSWYIGKPSATR